MAEAIVVEVARDQYRRRAERFGPPLRGSDGRVCTWAIVALGKLGGRELNYHSDLDLIFVYEEDGMTAGRPGEPPIANVQFFSDVARRVMRTLGEASGPGHLYTIDARLRPHGSPGRWRSPRGFRTTMASRRRSGSGWR